MAIIVAEVLSAVAEMQGSLENYNRVEQEAIAKRQEAQQHDERANAAKQAALIAIASVQTLLAEIQLRNQPQPANPVAEVEPNFPLGFRSDT